MGQVSQVEETELSELHALRMNNPSTKSTTVGSPYESKEQVKGLECRMTPGNWGLLSLMVESKEGWNTINGSNILFNRKKRIKF